MGTNTSNQRRKLHVSTLPGLTLTELSLVTKHFDTIGDLADLTEPYDPSLTPIVTKAIHYVNTPKDTETQKKTDKNKQTNLANKTILTKNHSWFEKEVHNVPYFSSSSNEAVIQDMKIYEAEVEPNGESVNELHFLCYSHSFKTYTLVSGMILMSTNYDSLPEIHVETESNTLKECNKINFLKGWLSCTRNTI